MGENVKHVLGKYHLTWNNVINENIQVFDNIIKQSWACNVNELYIDYSSVIYENVMMRDGLTHGFFNNDECDVIIQFLCTV